MKKLLIFSCFLLVLSLSFLLFGCQSNNKSINTNTPTMSSTEELGLLIPKVTETKITKYTPTQNSTPLINNTETKTAPTIILLPTVPPFEASIRVLDLMENNAGCQLPCWWGISPGKTDWGTAYQILMPISHKIDLLDEYVYLSRIVNSDTFSAGLEFIIGNETIEQSYSIRNNFVQQVEIRLAYAKKYTLFDIFTKIGKPEELWLQTYSVATDPGLQFNLLISYPSRGILVYYSSNNATINDGMIHKCYEDDTASVIDLWDPSRGKSTEQISRETPMFRDMATFERFQAIESTTELSIDSFVEKIINLKESCIVTPAMYWPNPYYSP